MDCVIINRVSDEKQKDGYSLTSQSRLGREYALSRGFTILREFTFQESASISAQRKLYEEYLRFVREYIAKRNSPLNLVAEKSDRMWRNHTDKEFIQIRVIKGTVIVHYYKDGRVFDKSCTPSDIFIDDVMTSISRYTALNIGREARKGMTESCLEGWMPGMAPWGYKNETRAVEGRTRSIIVPDPRSVPMVQRIYFLRAEYSYSYDKIFEVVKNEGLVPLIKKKGGKFKQFHPSTVEKILKNIFYGGVFRYGADTVYQGKHELIITPDLYARVQASFSGASVGINQHQKNLFGGWLSCGRDGCGCKISFHVHTKKSGLKFEHYICANGRRVHKSLKGMYVTEGQLLNAFEPALDAITITAEMAKDIRASLIANHQRVLDRQKREAESYDQALKSLELREDELYSDLKDGVLDEEGYKRHLGRVREDRKKYSGLLHQYQRQELDTYLQKANIALELATNAKTLWKGRNPVEQRDFLKMILWNPRLDPPSVRYEMKKPFKLLAQMATSENWGNRRGLNPRHPESQSGALPTELRLPLK